MSNCQMTQNPPRATSWGFESPLRHHKTAFAVFLLPLWVSLLYVGKFHLQTPMSMGLAPVFACPSVESVSPDCEPPPSAPKHKQPQGCFFITIFFFIKTHIFDKLSIWINFCYIFRRLCQCMYCLH